MRRESLCGVVLVLCLAVQAGAQEISGEGSVSGEGVRLNAQAATVRDVSLLVISTGAGWARSSFAQAQGIIASGDADFEAHGVAVEARTGVSAQMFEGATAADSTAVATGIQVQGREARSFAVTDLAVLATSGDVEAESQNNALAQARSSATATGMWIFSSGSGWIQGQSVIEAVSGSATALGGRGESVAFAEALGARVSSGDLIHDGSMRVAATGGQATASSPDLYAEARAMAIGLQADRGSVEHRGDLSVTATAGNIVFLSGSGQAEGRLPAQANGISAGGEVLSLGSVSVQAQAGTVTDPQTIRTGVAVATGISAKGAVSQSGDTTVSAVGTAALATGISGASVSHSGDLQVTAFGDRAAGMGIVASGDVLNIGSVSVQADGPATGVYFSDSGSLVSLMPLSVRSGSGENREVAAAENAVVRVREYNLGLGSATGQTFGGPGRITMDQTRLLLRPAPGFELNKFYRVQSGTLESELGSAVIDGEVTSVASLHPDLVAELATSPTEPALPAALTSTAQKSTPPTSMPATSTPPNSPTSVQSVALTYSPPSSLPGESAKARLSTVMYTGTVVRDQLTAGLFRPLGNREATGRVFARPYASDLLFDGSPAGYRGRMAGAVVGVDWLLADWTVGVHGGGDETRLDFKGAYEGRDEKSTAVYGGVHVARLFENGLAPMFTSTLFRVEHQADLGTGPGMEESARSRTLAWYNTAGLAYVWRISDEQLLVPEIVLSHVWQLRRRHETDTPAHTVNTRFGELNDHELYASAALRWIAEFPLSDSPDASAFLVHAGGGVRRTLTDGKISVEQSLDGIHWSRPEVQSERTAGFVSAGFGMRHQNLSWDITAQADLASHARTLGVHASLRWDF